MSMKTRLSHANSIRCTLPYNHFHQAWLYTEIAVQVNYQRKALTSVVVDLLYNICRGGFTAHINMLHLTFVIHFKNVMQEAIRKGKISGIDTQNKCISILTCLVEKYTSPLVHESMEFKDLITTLKETQFESNDSIPYSYITAGTLVHISEKLIHASITCIEAGMVKNLIQNLGEVIAYIPITDTQVSGTRIDSICKAYVALMYKCMVFRCSIPTIHVSHMFRVVTMVSTYLYERLSVMISNHESQSHDFQQRAFGYLIEVRMIMQLLDNYLTFSTNAQDITTCEFLRIVLDEANRLYTRLSASQTQSQMEQLESLVTLKESTDSLNSSSFEVAAVDDICFCNSMR